VVEFGVASEVAAHLADRFLGSTRPDAGILEVMRDPTQGLGRQTFSGPVVSLPAPVQPCLEHDYIEKRSGVTEKHDGRKKRRPTSARSETPGETREAFNTLIYEMSVVWYELCLFSVVEDATPTNCVH